MSEEKLKSVLEFADRLVNDWNKSLDNCSYSKKTIEDMPSAAILEQALMWFEGGLA